MLMRSAFKRYRLFFHLFLIGLFFALTFQNCSKVKFNGGEELSSALSIEPDQTPNTSAGDTSPVTSTNNKLTINVNGSEAPLKVLMIVDNSATMSQSQTELGNTANSLLQGISQIDTKMMITSTTLAGNNYSETCFNKTLGVASPNCNITEMATEYDQIKEIASDVNYTLDFSHKNSASELNSKTNLLKTFFAALGTQGSDNESGLAVLNHFLTKSAGNSVFKDGDKASIVIVTDENDSSTEGPSDYFSFPVRSVNSIKVVPYYSAFAILPAVVWTAELVIVSKVVRDGVSLDKKILLLDSPVHYFPAAFISALTPSSTQALNSACGSMVLSQDAKDLLVDQFGITNSTVLSCKLIQTKYTSGQYYSEPTTIPNTVETFLTLYPSSTFTYNERLNNTEVSGNGPFDAAHSTRFTLNSPTQYPLVRYEAVKTHEATTPYPKNLGTINSHPQRNEMENILGIKYADDKKTFLRKTIVNKLEKTFGRDGFHVTMLIVDGQKCQPKAGQSVGEEYLKLGSELGTRASLVPICQTADFESVMKELAVKTTKTATTVFTLQGKSKISQLKSVVILRNGSRQTLTANQYGFDPNSQRLTLLSPNLALPTDQLEISY
jgi:hypothetical protein